MSSSFFPKAGHPEWFHLSLIFSSAVLFSLLEHIPVNFVQTKICLPGLSSSHLLSAYSMNREHRTSINQGGREWFYGRSSAVRKKKKGRWADLTAEEDKHTHTHTSKILRESMRETGKEWNRQIKIKRSVGTISRENILHQLIWVTFSVLPKFLDRFHCPLSFTFTATREGDRLHYCFKFPVLSVNCLTER